MPKNKNIMFQPRSTSRKENTKKFYIVLTACVLGVLAVSCLAILIKYNFDLNSVVGGDMPTETETVTEVNAAQEISADKTYFLWCSESDSKKMRFAWLVNIRLPEREISACTLEPSNHVNYGEKSISLEELYIQQGEGKLISALQESTGIKIDGCMGSDDESFKSIINYIGGINVTIPEQIEYRGEEFTLILVKGKQNLKGDTLLKYLRYLDTLGKKGKNHQATVILEAFDHIFKPDFISRQERLFSKISNTLETDLTIVDFSSVREGATYLMENGLKAKRTAESPELLTEEHKD